MSTLASIERMRWSVGEPQVHRIRASGRGGRVARARFIDPVLDPRRCARQAVKMLGSKDVERLEPEAPALEPEDRAAPVDALLESIAADEVVALSATFRAELQRR